MCSHAQPLFGVVRCLVIRSASFSRSRCRCCPRGWLLLKASCVDHDIITSLGLRLIWLKYLIGQETIPMLLNILAQVLRLDVLANPQVFSLSAFYLHAGSTTWTVVFVVPALAPPPSQHMLRMSSSWFQYPRGCSPVGSVNLVADVRTALSNVGQLCGFTHEPCAPSREQPKDQCLSCLLLCQTANRQTVRR